MSNKADITMNDFDNICRTCLCRENLKPLYEKCFAATSLAEMLMYCTVVKFSEDDGLPVQICTNCINEIKQTFSFANRCETTDTILRKCVKNMKTELTNNSFSSQKLEPTIEAEEEMKIEVKQEKILPHIYRSVKNVLQDYKSVVKVERKDSKIEYMLETSLPTVEKILEDFEYVEDVQIDNECDEIYDDPADESYKEEEDDEDQNETYSEKSSHVCAVCSKAFAQRICLKKHMRIHSFEKSYPCNVCNKAFKYSYYLKYHMRIHTGEKPYCCTICDKTFTHSFSLKNHIRIHTGEKHTCEVCNKVFSRKFGLKCHMSLHTGQGANVCAVCNKAFVQSRSLKYHMRKKHNGEKEKRPYSCEACNKTFTQSNNLKTHMRIHTGEKPYCCKICDKTFTHSLSLKTHIRTHTGEKGYSCEVCNKVFSRSFGLKCHMSRHTGQGANVCAVCNKAFVQSKSLKFHMRTNHSEDVK